MKKIIIVLLIMVSFLTTSCGDADNEIFNTDFNNRVFRFVNVLDDENYYYFTRFENNMNVFYYMEKIDFNIIRTDLNVYGFYLYDDKLFFTNNTNEKYALYSIERNDLVNNNYDDIIKYGDKENNLNLIESKFIIIDYYLYPNEYYIPYSCFDLNNNKYENESGYYIYGYDKDNLYVNIMGESNVDNQINIYKYARKYSINEIKNIEHKVAYTMIFPTNYIFLVLYNEHSIINGKHVYYCIPQDDDTTGIFKKNLNDKNDGELIYSSDTSFFDFKMIAVIDSGIYFYEDDNIYELSHDGKKINIINDIDYDLNYLFVSNIDGQLYYFNNDIDNPVIKDISEN